MANDSHADQLAWECVRARTELRRAAQVLHDDIGSSLEVAGLHLQLLCMDLPAATEKVVEIAQALEAAMESVRLLSRELEPSPARRTGLKVALLNLAEDVMQFHGLSVTLRYTATVTLSTEAADALYHAAAAAVTALVSAKKPAPVTLAVTGSRGVAIRVSAAAKLAGKPLAAAALLARHAGLDFAIVTKTDTLVIISYAFRRISG